MSKKYVVDTSALCADTFSFNDGVFLTTPYVLRESSEHLYADVRVKNEDILVMRPKMEFISRVREVVKEVFGGGNLSCTDIEVVALAMQEEVEVISDDYGIQHIADKVGVSYSPVRIPAYGEGGSER